MKRFRKWLIHKLGGICKEEIPQPIINQIKVEKIKNEYEFTNERYQTMLNNSSEEIIVEQMNNFFIHNLGEAIFKYAKIEKTQGDDFVKWSATVRVIDERGE